MAKGVNGPPLDTVAIISTVVEGILYGFSVLMFCLTVWVLFRNKKASEANKPMLAVACLLLIFSSMHIAVDIDRIYLGFIGFRGILEPVQYFADVSQETFVFKNAVYSFQTAVGDGVVLYRAWAVWRTPWPLVLPVLLYGSVLATAIGSVYTVSITSPNSSNIFFKTTGQWITAFYASTFTCNVVATITLAVRLWWIERKAAAFRQGGGTLRPIVLIVIDSGLLYSVTLLVTLIGFANSSNAQFFLLDFVTPIISISFYAVILRVALVQAAKQQAFTASLKASVGTGNGSGVGRNTTGFQSRGQKNTAHTITIGEAETGYYDPRTTVGSMGGVDEGYAMKPLRVDITQEHSQFVDKPWNA